MLNSRNQKKSERVRLGRQGVAKTAPANLAWDRTVSPPIHLWGPLPPKVAVSGEGDSRR